MDGKTIEVSDLKRFWQNNDVDVWDNVTVTVEQTRNGQLTEMPLALTQAHWNGHNKWSGLEVETRGEFRSQYRIYANENGEWDTIKYKNDGETEIIGDVKEVRIDK